MYESVISQGSWQSLSEKINTETLSEGARSIVELEQEIPVSVGIDTSLRPKILDKCGMSCTFCHNEGTPVEAAHLLSPSIANPLYSGGRVSVFSSSNGVDFLPGIMRPDENYDRALRIIAKTIGATELHMTGGEPTLHPQLVELIKMAKHANYTVKLTSNGENGARVFEACAEAGLEKVNFSIFGTTPTELAAVQHPRFRSEKLAGSKMHALKRSIEAALAFGIRADANIVMSSPVHEDRVKRLIDEYDDRVTVRVLNDLGLGESSNVAIYEMLSRIGATPKELYVEAGSSNSRVKYSLPSGRDIYFKQIRRTTLPSTCATCTLNNDKDCAEGYYGVRLYTDKDMRYKVGVCMQRMDLTMPIEEFEGSSISSEITELRYTEFDMLKKYYTKRLTS